MSVYTDVFGGEQVSPSQLDYVSYIMTTDIHAVWPFEALPDAYITPAKVDLQALSSGLRFFMGKADLASPGQDCLISNRGAFPILVTDVDGNSITSVDPGLSWLVWVEDNDTPVGVWRAIQYGAGVSETNAGALAGAGLRSVSTRLDVNFLTTPFLAAHNVTQGDRAQVLQNNGGSVTWTADDPATLGNGFFFALMNSGSGTVTFDPTGAVTIDGQTTKVFQSGENALIFSDGTNFFSLGYGRALSSSITGAAISLAPGGTKVLTPTEVAAQVQDFSGALLSNAIVEYGSGVGYWFVWNNTNGAFTMTARTTALDTGVTIPQNNFSILRSNGAEMEIAFTATTGTVTSVGTTAGELVGGPITSTGVLGLANTTVVPGSYGLAASVPQVTFDQKGRATGAANVPIQITMAQVTGLTAALTALVPPGTGPIPWSGGAAPSGWLLCDGAAVSRATFSALNAVYSALGYPYGAGNGTTTFNVPDMRGIVPAGMDLMTGSATGNANRISTYVPSTTIGASGGVQGYAANTLVVTGNVTVSQIFGLTVSLSSVATSGPSSSIGRGDVGGSHMVATNDHTHTVTGNFAVDGSSTSATAAFTNGRVQAALGIVQPTRVFNYIVKT